MFVHPDIAQAAVKDVIAMRIAEAEAVARLAELSERPAGTGPWLVADVDGGPAAAVSLADQTVLADPFQRTAHLVELLHVRAHQLVPRRRRLHLFGGGGR